MMSDNREEEAREARRQRLWEEELGMPAPPWLDESLAPPITDDALSRLEQYARNEVVDDDERRTLTELTVHFKSWSEALLRTYDNLNQRDV